MTWDINAGNLLTIIIMVAGFIITYTKLIARITKWETKLEIMWMAFSRRWTGNHDQDENPFDSPSVPSQESLTSSHNAHR